MYELNPANKNQYRYKNHWEPFRVIHDEIAVRDQAAVAVDLRFTCHGPVIYVEDEKNRAFAVRTEWLEPGTAPYMGSLSFMRARTFQQFKTALNGWGSPPINHVYGIQSVPGASR